MQPSVVNFISKQKSQKDNITQNYYNNNNNIQNDQSSQLSPYHINSSSSNQKHYDIDVIQVSNIALAIKNKQHTINIQLSVRCQNLPLMKTFGGTDSIMVIYKSNDLYEEIRQRQIITMTNHYQNIKQSVLFNKQNSYIDQINQKTYMKKNKTYNNNNNNNNLQEYNNNNNNLQQWIQIGRTQIIYNSFNPKFIKTFVFSYNQQKQQKIQFRIYDIIDFSKLDDLNQQVKIGTVTKSMVDIAENDHGQFQIQLQNKKKGKAVLKTNCAQYDSGNSKYQIGLQLNNFVGKLQVFYVIQVLKLNQWIPISKSQSIQIKKNQRFKQTQISYSKFPAQDNSRIKIKVYEISRTKSRLQQQIGSTDQLTIINILTTDDKTQTQRVYKNGFVVGVIKINKWRKVIRDSFISYIVNGATLHLILGIDFSNSNQQNGNSYHKITNGTNPYIEGIRKIIGVLQYFDYYNQIALYGFGAQLPPYYRSVGQCFALNGNYFNPIVVGGVEQIIKLYIQNLQKNKLHGPTKFSQIIDLSILYAQSQQNSSNYYVLVLMTDGQINDYYETVQRVIKASSLPLSIIIVGIGDKDFTLIQNLDSDKQKLTSQNGQTCQRDIVDFIRLDQFNFDKGDVTLARQTFAEIPSHFIQYMTKKNIKPNREKKSLKAAKQDFISEKIKQSKNLSNDTKPIVVIPQFLQYQKKKMKKDLINLGFDPQDPLLRDLNIAMNDLNYFIQVHSFNKTIVETKNIITVQKIAQKQQKTLQEYLDMKDLENKKKTLQKLQKIQTNQYGRQLKQKIILAPKQQQKRKYLYHPCLKCNMNQIDYLHIQCGHASVCEKCVEKRCYVCYYVNQAVWKISQVMENNEDSDYSENSYNSQNNQNQIQDDYQNYLK